MTDMVYLFEEEEEKMPIFFEEEDVAAENDEGRIMLKSIEESLNMNENSEVFKERESSVQEGISGIGSFSERNIFYSMNEGENISESFYAEQKNSFLSMEERNDVNAEFFENGISGRNVLKTEFFENRSDGREAEKSSEKNISVTVNNNVSVTKECDIDDVIERLSAKIAEAVEAAGEGMHI